MGDFDDSGEYRESVWREDLKLRMTKSEEQDSDLELD